MVGEPNLILFFFQFFEISNLRDQGKERKVCQFSAFLSAVLSLFLNQMNINLSISRSGGVAR